jgi:hypothetical protein
MHVGLTAEVPGVRDEFVQQSEPLWSECPEHKVYARHVAARPVEPGNETQLDRVAPLENTIGIVIVAAFAASPNTLPPVAASTATGRPTSSAASHGRWS